MADEAIRAGRTINRLVVAFEAGYDGFWLARWLRARKNGDLRDSPDEYSGITGASASEPDRPDTGLFLRAVPGWLHERSKHCHIVSLPNIAEEDAQSASRA